MTPSPFLSFLPFLLPLFAMATLAFLVAAIIEGRVGLNRGKVVRTIYFYLISLFSLLVFASSLIFLANLGFKAWVFPKADEVSVYRYGPPPSLYLGTAKETATGPMTSAYACKDKCEFSETDKESVASWTSNYQEWKNGQDLSSQRQRDLVGGLSFLIVSLPLFLLHFRLIQKEAKNTSQSAEEKATIIRPTYFYIMALSSLMAMVVSVALLVNLGLKTWVFPKADETGQPPMMKVSAPFAISEKTGVESLINCQAKCGFSDDQATLAKEWLNDYKAWENGTVSKTSNRQNEAATYFSILLIAIPLFWYHWRAVRKEARVTDLNKEEKN